MTETQWLACTDPAPMQAFLHGQLSARKLRLFDAACCWAVWPLLDDERSERAIEQATRDADGLVSAVALRQVAREACDAWAQRTQDTESYDSLAPMLARQAAYLLAAAPEEQLRFRTTPRDLAAHALAHAERDRLRPRIHGGLAPLPNTRAESEAFDQALVAALAGQAALLRDIAGNPFRPAPTFLDWRAWGGGMIPNLARSIDEEHAFQRLPVLADALHEAGCVDARILLHCYEEGPHVRGCWVVDLVLGKN